jgi:putative ABC transport system permease protein
VTTLEDVAWDATSRHRFRAVMVTTFAGLALVLAMIGVFGILAYSVQQRARLRGAPFRVEPLDPATFAFVALLLAASAAASIAGPAWRAARVDRAAALRDE